MPDNSIDLIVTDPPYLMNYRGQRQDKEHKFNKAILNDDNEQIIIDYTKECSRILKDDAAIYMFCNSNRVEFFKIELEKYFNLKNIIVWVKNNWTSGDTLAQYGKLHEFLMYANKGRRKLNGKRIGDVWSYKKVVGKNQLHQNQKPLDLIIKAIKKSSDEGDVVFDGFMGSGTTAIACIKTNRKFIGYELDKEYFDIAKTRIQEEENQIRMMI